MKLAYHLVSGPASSWPQGSYGYLSQPLPPNQPAIDQRSNYKAKCPGHFSDVIIICHVPLLVGSSPSLHESEVVTTMGSNGTVDDHGEQIVLHLVLQQCRLKTQEMLQLPILTVKPW